MGRGGVAVVRISGPLVDTIAAALLTRRVEVGQVRHCDFVDEHRQAIDDGIVLKFKAPCSYTGEDVLELHGHGGPVVVSVLLSRVLALGARLAKPGEFTERAFLNDKMDLAQAEAVADLIDSQTELAARSARMSVQGEFSRRVEDLLTALIEARAYTESAIDFPDEDIESLTDAALSQRLENLCARLTDISDIASTGARLRDGVAVVIQGPPNVGKSSLLNSLAGTAHAIVTDVPGTTRDLLRVRIELNGFPVELIDTAGLRETDDPVERIGVELAQNAATEADLIVLMCDDSNPSVDDHPAKGVPTIVVCNKVDVSGGVVGERLVGPDNAVLGVSVLQATGLDELRAQICRLANLNERTETPFLARRRHLNALDRASTAVQQARTHLRDRAGCELAAEELRLAQQALSEITGEFTTDDLLDSIFTSFCIGK